MTKILLEVDTEDRECSLVPMSIKLNFEDYLTAEEKSRFSPLSIRMIDRRTGRVIPCQFSVSDENKLKGTLSWILLNEAQKELEVRVGEAFLSHHGSAVWDRGDGRLEIFLNGEHVADYVFNEAYERPFLYPVIGPDGFCVTRSVPTLGDHPHHKGISLALGEVSDERGKRGVNFWGLGIIGDPTHGRVIHQKFNSLEQGPVFIRIREENIWKQNDELKGRNIEKRGKILMRELRTITLWNVSPIRIIDIHSVLIPATDEIVLNEDPRRAKENGPLRIRVADSMRGNVAGTIVNSEGGRTEKECWGRRARWVDYYGPVIPGGPINGIAAMDHPENVRHPPGWHVRDYGLFAVNPFCSMKPEWPDQGPIYLSKEKDEKLNLKYRIYIHRGDEKEGRVEQKWQDWVNPPRVHIE